jgi:signal transduction histidine kinase
MEHFFQAISDWLTGVSPTNPAGYMRLRGCMGHDWFWIFLTVFLDLSVAAGYVVIAHHWYVNEKSLPAVPAKRALGTMKNIFIFCGLCGYIFIPVKMFWPAWRLYDMFMAALVYYTWRYAWNTSNLKVVYSELGRSTQLAADLEKSREEAKRKSYFLNAISHDLRTPLNGLMLQASVAEMSLAEGDSASARQALAEIQAAASSTAHLLHSLLEYAQLDWAEEPNRTTTFDLAPLLDEVTRTARPMAEQKSLDVRVTCPAGIALRTDRSKLDRIMQNLLTNAIKFTERGAGRGVVRIEVQAAEAGVELHVIDSGIGIAAEDQARLFDEFVTLNNHERNPKKGFGLGLSIARRLARQLGGEISLDSAPGRGSRFTVLLPEALARRDARSEPVEAVASV